MTYVFYLFGNHNYVMLRMLLLIWHDSAPAFYLKKLCLGATAPPSKLPSATTKSGARGDLSLPSGNAPARARTGVRPPGRPRRGRQWTWSRRRPSQLVQVRTTTNPPARRPRQGQRRRVPRAADQASSGIAGDTAGGHPRLAQPRGGSRMRERRRGERWRATGSAGQAGCGGKMHRAHRRQPLKRAAPRECHGPSGRAPPCTPVGRGREIHQHRRRPCVSRKRVRRRGYGSGQWCLGGWVGSSARMAPGAEAGSDAMAMGGRWRERGKERRGEEWMRLGCGTHMRLLL
jgi:hypothetical protein